MALKSDAYLSKGGLVSPDEAGAVSDSLAALGRAIDPSQLAGLVVDSVPEGLVVCDRQLRYVLWNRFMEQVTGESASDVLGQPALQRHTWWQEHGLDRLLQQALEGQVSPELDFAYRSARSGWSGWLSVRAGPVRAAGGQTVGVAVVTRDVTARVQQEQAQAQRAARYQALAEGTPDAVFVISREDRIEYVNRSGAAWCGRTPEQLIGQPRSAVFLDKAGPQQWAALQEVFKTGLPVYREERTWFPTGERWLSTWLTPMRNAAGEIVAVQGVARDITQQKQAEEALRVQTAALASAANSIVITDADGRIVWVNPAFTRLTGYEAAEVLGQNPRLLKSGRHDAAFYQALWATIAAGRVWHGELINRRKDGSLYTEEMTITPVRGNGGAITHFVAIKQDVTARKQMEQELRQSRERFLAIFQSSPTPVAITTLEEGRYLDVNQAFLRMMGYRREEVLGRTVAELGVWEQPADRQRLVQLVRQQGAVENFEARFRDGSGRLHDCLASVKLVQLGQEPVLIFISHDITERKALEAQLRQAQKMESLGTLAGGVAHDFNNILTLIQGHAGLLLRNPKLPPDCLESVQELARAAEQAGHLTRQLLTFSRKQPLQLRRLDLNEAVGHLTKMLRRIIGEDITLELKFCPRPLPVVADVGMIEQLLMNLAVNARDAMPQGGQLTIATEAVQVDLERLPQGVPANGAGFARLVVRDTGCGIPPENLGRIFDPFYTTKEVGKGTGLGLATVHGIVQQHRGWIEVESQVQVGTSFRIYLPLEPRQAEADDQPPGPPLVRGGTETILLVEDEEPVRELARLVLEQHGYRVIPADSGRTALALWPQHQDQVDLLLTDLVMPGGLTGWQLAERLRAAKPGLKVVLTSGYSQDVGSLGLHARTGVAFLPKPYPPHVLAQAVRECLDGNRVDAREGPT